MPNPDRLARGQCCDLISDKDGIRRGVCRDPGQRRPLESMEVWRDGQWVLVQDHGRILDR